MASLLLLATSNVLTSFSLMMSLASRTQTCFGSPLPSSRRQQSSSFSHELFQKAEELLKMNNQYALAFELATKETEIEKLKGQKDTEIEKLKGQKDTEIAMKDTEIEKLKGQKDTEIEKLKGQLVLATECYLAARGALTSRGVFEN
eukprot:1470068-Rhodomonas_salina.1